MYTIKVSDGFVEWEYVLKGSNKYSIQDIVDAVTRNTNLISDEGTIVEKDTELAALRSLLSDAMKALEPFATAEPTREKVEGKELDWVAQEETEFTYRQFYAAAEVAARIKATLTGGE